MPQPYRITITSKQDPSPTVLEGAISDDAWQRLLDFVRYAEPLRASRAVVDGLEIEWSLSVDAAGTVSMSGKPPPPDEFAALLHLLRPFVLESERTYVPRVLNALSKEIQHPRFHKGLQPIRDMFTGQDLRDQMQVSLGDVLVNSEKVLNAYLNAVEYHRDDDKRHFLDTLLAGYGIEAFRPFFSTMIVDKAKAVIALDKLVRAMQRRDGTMFRTGVAATDEQE